MATTGINPDGSTRTRLDQLPRVAALAIGSELVLQPIASKAKDGKKPTNPETFAQSADSTTATNASAPDQRKTDTNTGKSAESFTLAGWPTQQEDNANNAYGHKGTSFSDLPTTAQLAGWATPDASAMNLGEGLETWDVRQAKNKEKHGNGNGAGMPLQIQVQTIFGQDLKSSTAGTEKPAALNPDHSRWLMGFPAAWGCCGATAMRSCRKSRRSSLEPPAAGMTKSE
jgi:hypothetical protein